MQSGRAFVHKVDEKKGKVFWETKDVSLEGQKIEFKEGLTFSKEELESVN